MEHRMVQDHVNKLREIKHPLESKSKYINWDGK